MGTNGMICSYQVWRQAQFEKVESGKIMIVAQG